MTWNHRVVRRYKATPDAFKHICGPEQSWLEITEVYYDKDGKPDGYACDMGTPIVGIEDGITPEQALEDLRWTVEHMLKALDKPVLDEKTDFAQEIDVEDPLEG